MIHETYPQGVEMNKLARCLLILVLLAVTVSVGMPPAPRRAAHGLPERRAVRAESRARGDRVGAQLPEPAHPSRQYRQGWVRTHPGLRLSAADPAGDLREGPLRQGRDRRRDDGNRA